MSFQIKNTEEVNGYYALIYKWLKKDGFAVLDDLTKTLEALSVQINDLPNDLEKLPEEFLDEAANYQKIKELILKLPSPEDASINEIKDVCNDILIGELIWCTNFTDKHLNSIGGYAKSILDLTNG